MKQKNHTIIYNLKQMCVCPPHKVREECYRRKTIIYGMKKNICYPTVRRFIPATCIFVVHFFCDVTIKIFFNFGALFRLLLRNLKVSDEKCIIKVNFIEEKINSEKKIKIYTRLDKCKIEQLLAFQLARYHLKCLVPS